MNKHRKTRQQKIISQLRHQIHQKELTLSFPPAAAATVPFSSRSFPIRSLSADLSLSTDLFAEDLLKAEVLTNAGDSLNTPLVITTTVSRDLSKTTFVTAAIISLELILYFLLEGR